MTLKLRDLINTMELTNTIQRRQHLAELRKEEKRQQKLDLDDGECFINHKLGECPYLETPNY